MHSLINLLQLVRANCIHKGFRSTYSLRRFIEKSKHNVLVEHNYFNLCHRCSSTKEGFKSNDFQQLLDNAATFENETDDNWTPDNAWATSPYPKGTVNHRLQSSHALRPRIDPRQTSLILFPGEGSQYVGMGANLISFPGVKDIFSAANEILNYDLLSLCLQGPKSKLDQTKYAQVAVMVSSLAALEKLREERPSSVECCIATGGFGVGEITALTFAGVFSFERAVRLAQLRGEAMETASEMEPGGMMMVMYNVTTKFHEILTKAKEYASEQGVEKPICEVAQYLFPHCKVIAGHIQVRCGPSGCTDGHCSSTDHISPTVCDIGARTSTPSLYFTFNRGQQIRRCLDFINKNYRQLKLDKVRRLNVAGAHYTSLMRPAAMTFKKYVERSNLNDPVIAVHSTTNGKTYSDKKDVVRKLPKQMMTPIRWEQMMHILYERPANQHFPSTFEVGPGNSLKTVLKMVNAKAYDSCYSVFDAPTV